MSTATTYSKLGYLMLKKESTAATAVYPNTAFELLSESIVTNWDISPVNTIAGNRSLNSHSVLNKVSGIEGSIELWVEPTTIGHVLTGLFGTGTDTTLTASTSYQHDYQPQNTLISYTMDIKMAGNGYVTRYFGVRVASAEFSLDENKLKLTLNVTAQRVFSCARVLVAATSGTALRLDQTTGLTTSDTLVMLDDADKSTILQELTISSITNETTLVTSTISGAGASLAIDDIAVIKAQSPTYSLSNEFIWSGGAEVYYASGANGIQNLAVKSNVEDFKLTVTNEIEPRWSATGNDVIDRMPASMLLKGVSVEGSFKQFFVNPEWLDVLRKNEQTTLRFDFLGNVITANSAAAASGTLLSNGVSTVVVTTDASEEAGNDWAIKVVQGTSTLSATLSGKLITVTLASVAGNNTTSLVASAIAALTGVASSSIGADLINTTVNPNKVFFTGGRDASEVEKLRFDLPNVHLQPFNANLSTDDVLNEEVSFVAYRDSNDRREIATRLRNATSTY